jgi:pimeloyl-ACP methyl ester carboxylesterase
LGSFILLAFKHDSVAESPHMKSDTLMLVPGLLCDAAVWQPQVQALGDEVRSIVLIEHGTQNTLAALASAALAGAPARFALAGHSMGGRVALEIFRQAPQRVTRLALLDTGTAALDDGEAGVAERSSRLRLLEQARRDGMRAMGMSWSRAMVHPDRLRDAKLMDAILAMVERRSLQEFTTQVEALLTRPDATALLSQIHVPTLVLCGLEDTWSPLARHREIAARLDRSVLVGIPGCGHMSTLERPQAVSDALRAWLCDEPQIHRVSL